MRILLLFVLLSLSSTGKAKNAIQLREIYLLGKQYGEKNREPLIDSTGLDRQLDKELSLVWNLDIWKNFYWDNKIESLLDRDWENKKSNSQWRMIGWNYQLGFRVCSFLHIEHEHFSKHYTDYKSGNKFPVKDSIGFKLFFYKK